MTAKGMMVVLAGVAVVCLCGWAVGQDTAPAAGQAVDLTKPFEVDKDTLHLYHLDDVASGTAKDEGSGKQDGTVTDATEVDGKFGKALGVDGTKGCVAIDTKSKVEGVPALTVECWVKFNGDKARGDIVCQQSAYMLRTSGGSLVGLLRIDGKWRAVKGEKAIPVGTWVHLAMTYDAAKKEAKLYINGTLDVTKAPESMAKPPEEMTEGKLSFMGTMLKLGVNTWTPESYINGSLDEVRVSTVVRTYKPIE
jgi:hypothetical protein